jgi:hypothetical protein
MNALQPGDGIRYLNLGTGKVECHACPPGQCGDRYTLHRYWVYLDNPSVRRNRLVWLYESDRIKTGSAA